MNWVKGTDLPAAARLQATATYVHRYTKEHVPAWAVQDGNSVVLFASDEDWLAHTNFPLNGDGSLRTTTPCMSSPTWPHNPELRR